MSKTIKFLLILICVLLFIIFLLKGYEKEKINIAEKIGPKVGESELSMTDYYALKQIIEDNYKKYLLDGEYERAYNMLSPAYWAYVPFKDYESKMPNKDIEELRISGIKRVTKTTYHATANQSGEDFTIILNQDDGKFSLLPESFIGHSTLNVSKSNRKLKCTVKDYLVNVDETIFNCEIFNSSKEDITINSGTLITNLEDKIKKDLQITIPSKQKIDVLISFDTYYAFPKKLTLNRENGEEEDIEYVFEINK